MNKTFSLGMTQSSTFRAGSNPCHSIHEEDDKEDNEQINAACQEQRRLSRLYGSKARNLKRGRFKGTNKKSDNETPKGSSTKQKEMITTDKKNNGGDTSNGKQSKEVQKFFDKPRNDELLMDIHADNYKINHPWFVGYQNTISLQGSPHALASRYGFNGAVRISNQWASQRQDDLVTLLEQIAANKEMSNESSSSCSSVDGIDKTKKEDNKETSSVTRIGGIKSRNLSPRKSKRPQSCPVNISKGKNNPSKEVEDMTDKVKTKKLDRAKTRETALWKDIVRKAKYERTQSANGKLKSRPHKDVYKTKLTKHCARSIRMRHESASSHKVFVLS